MGLKPASFQRPGPVGEYTYYTTQPRSRSATLLYVLLSIYGVGTEYLQSWPWYNTDLGTYG